MKHTLIQVRYVRIFFYILTAIMLLLLLTKIFLVYQYIQNLVITKQIVISQQLFTICITYMDNCLPYFFYMTTTAGIAYLIHVQEQSHVIKSKIINSNSPQEQLKEEDELDIYVTTR